MKKTLIAFLTFIVVFAVGAMGVKLGWNQSCDDSISGYNIYYDTASILTTPNISTGIDVCSGTNYSLYSYLTSFNFMVQTIGITNTTVCISNLSPGTTYIFGVTAFYPNNVESAGIQSNLYNHAATLHSRRHPTLNLNTVLVYITNWYNPPRIFTNKFTGKVVTNYYTATPYVRQLQADMFIATNWTMLSDVEHLRSRQQQPRDDSCYQHWREHLLPLADSKLKVLTQSEISHRISS